MIKKLFLKSGTNSINVQNSQDVKIGMNYSETKEMINDLFELNYPKLRQIAAEEAKSNVTNLANKLFEKVTSVQLINTTEIASSDFQFCLYKAIETGARFNNDWLHSMLADLLAKRISGNQNDSIKTILTESILTIGKLSMNQLKILTSAFLLYDYWIYDIKSWDDYGLFVKDKLVDFIDFENRTIDFKHIVYCGCASLDASFGPPSLAQIIKNKKPFLFPELSQHKDEQEYIESVIYDRVEIADKLFKLTDETLLWALDLSSVGIMIASVNFENTKSKRLENIHKYFE